MSLKNILQTTMHRMINLLTHHKLIDKACIYNVWANESIISSIIDLVARKICFQSKSPEVIKSSILLLMNRNPYHICGFGVASELKTTLMSVTIYFLDKPTVIVKSYKTNFIRRITAFVLMNSQIKNKN